MRIAMFSETYLPSANGVTTSIASARAHLHRNGHDVKVLAAGPRRHKADGVTYYGGRPMPKYPDFHLALGPAWGQTPPARLLRRWGADVAHLHSPGPMGWRGYHASRRNRLPYVYTYHTHLEPLGKYAPRGAGRAVTRIVVAAQDFLVRHASVLIVPSHFLLRTLQAEDPALAEGALVVPTGVDVQRFHPTVARTAARAAQREAWGLNESDEVLLSLGRLGVEKRVDFLLEAFARLASDRPNAKLVLAGRGPMRKPLEAHAARLGVADRVHFAGFVADEALPGAYAAADAFASASDFETQGITVLEAMAAGLPVAAAAAGGYLDPLHDGHNGHLFAPYDVEDARRALGLALEAPTALRTAARRTAEGYRIEHCAGLLERTYESTVAGAPAEQAHVFPTPGLVS